MRFFEEGPGGPHQIATTSKAKGSKRFTPRRGGDKTRRVYAVVEQNKLPRARIKLGTFHTRGNSIGKPTHLKGTLKGRKLKLRWRTTCGARRYLVRVVAAKKTILKAAKKPSLSVTVGKGAKSAKVTVWAITAAGVNGKPSGATVKTPKNR